MASPAANPRKAATATADRNRRSPGRYATAAGTSTAIAPALSPPGIFRDARDEQPLPVERLDDRENRDERVEDEHEEHQSRVQTSERRQDRPHQGRDERDSRDRAEEKQPVPGVPADLGVMA